MSLIVGFTHNDLDALGVILCTQHKLEIDRWFCTNYTDIDFQVKSCLDYCKSKNVHKIIIGDVSFSDRKDLLDSFYNYTSQFEDGYILHCDHHSYPDPETFWNCYPKMKVIYNSEISATLQMLSSFKINDSNLTKICKIIDSYDCWRKSAELFDISQMLNDYFWDFTRNRSDGSKDNQYNNIVILANLMKETGYKFPGDFKKVANQYIINAENDYNTFKAHNVLKQFNGNVKTTVILSKDSFTRIQLKEMALGQEFVVGIYLGMFMCRVNEQANFSLEFLRELRYQLCGKPDFCHPYAFTYPIENPTPERVLEEIKRILTVINNIPRDIKRCTIDDPPF